MAVRRTLAALLALPILLLTGCGDDSSIAEPPVRSSPPSSAPTTDPPAHETAEHFIRRWAEAEKQMENTGDTRRYVSLTDGCDACNRLVRDVKRIYANGGYIHWNGLSVLAVHRNTRQESGSLVFAVKTNSTPTRYKVSSSTPEHVLKGGITQEQVTLRSRDRGWLVTSRARLSH